MNKKKEKMLAGKEASFKPLLEIYKTTRLPWALLGLVIIISFGTQYINVAIASYSAKIDTGTMTGGNFLVAFAALTVMSIVCEYGYDLANTLGKAQMGRNVRKKLWGKLLRLPVSNYEKEDPQTLVSRITKDTEYAYSALTTVIQLISIIYGIIIAMVEVIALFGSYSWIMAAIIPVLFICSIVIGKIQYRIDRMINNVYARMTNFYSERLPNMIYIKTNNMEKTEYEKGLSYSNEKYRADIIYKFLFSLSIPLQSLANYISLVFILIVASAMVRAGTLSSVEMKELLLYFDVVIQDATLILGVWQAIQMSHGGCEKIAEINQAETEKDMGATSFPDGDIVFDHVSFGYLADKDVLRDVSFTIPAGKITAIVGENGSGKSTVTKLLERFAEPRTGNISIADQPLTTLSRSAWRHKLSYVFQGDQIVEGTVRDNIAYGADEKTSDEDIIKAAKQAEAYDFITEKEEGFATPLDIFTSPFSGGQLQRLAIARAMLKDCDYLMMDEATSGVDMLKEEAIFAAVKEKMKGKTLIIITHNMNVVKMADHVIFLNNGKVEAEGTQDEVKALSPTYQTFLQA